MLASKITTHVADALARLLFQYQGKPNIEALLGALAQRAQGLEDALYPLDAGRQVVSGQAEGAQLDGLGTLVGVKRNGLDDITFLLLILGTIAENHSDSTQAAVLNAVQIIFGAQSVFIKTPNTPGCDGDPSAWVELAVYLPTVASSAYPLLLQVVKNTLGAGIRLVSLGAYPRQKTFAMAGSQPWVGGFGDPDDPTVGGTFATPIT